MKVSLVSGPTGTEGFSALPTSVPLHTPPAAARFRRRLGRWFDLHGRDLPWRRTHDPYAILVSEIMLQQTQVATVAGYFERWMKLFPDFASLAAARETDVLHAWQGLGYYSRARNLRRAAQTVVEKHAGQMPREGHAIRALPGIGAYTAGAIAAFAFDRPEPAIDANVARVLARLFDVRGPIDSAAGGGRLAALGRALQPESGGRRFNSALMELGALVCRPRHPQCPGCPVAAFCAAPEPELLPRKKPRRTTVRVVLSHALIRRKGAILLEQQLTGARWRGLWILPAAASPAGGEELLTVRYPITHHQVTMRIVRERPPRRARPPQRWIPLAKLETIPMPSPHRRALRRLLPRS